MALKPGDHIGGYEIVALIDQGGQGAVYRARDAALGRDVALKVLARERFDDRRRVRFEREAHVLALLNHPNIATLHGVEHDDDVAALVMELVEGESLAGRLSSGPMALDQVLPIARQIADALEAAHDHGIVHRDLKPANIMVRPDGTVKLLDFGLAKAVAEVGAGAAAVTVTATGDGAGFVGTAAYMSPEQARGADVDRRTDVWAFGCVLYEMLTGGRAFDGATASDAIASVLHRDPDLTALPAETPDAVRRLIRRCLEKDLRHRLRDIGDARIELEEASGSGSDREPRDRRTARRFRARHIGITVACAAIAALAVWLVRPAPAPRPAPVSRLSVVLPAEAPFAWKMGGGNLAISADGARIVYSTTGGFALRSRDKFEVSVLTDVGTFPADPSFSPDGQWILYADGPELKRVPVTGGRPIKVADVGPGVSAGWGEPGIVFADASGMFRVPLQGGNPVRLPLKLSETEHPSTPGWLLGGQAVLFTILPSRTNWTLPGIDAPGSRIEVLDLRTRTQKTLVRGGSFARFLPPDLIVYNAGNALAAVRLDLERLEIRGEPVRLMTGGFGEFDLSDEGTLVQLAGTNPDQSTLVWVDRSGKEEAVGAPPRRYVYPRVSPDGSRIALVLFVGEDRDIWIWDRRRRALERFTADPAANPLIAWSLDGSGLAFGSDRFGPTNLFWQTADGAPPTRLLVSPHIQMPVSFAAGGRLLFSHEVPGKGRNIDMLTIATGEVEPVIATPSNELNAEVSRDGRWIAYDSNESGQFEVYVRPFPATRGGRWQVSAGGGRQPVWSRTGAELYYRNFDGAVVAVPVRLAPTFEPGPPQEVLAPQPRYHGRGPYGSGRTYDVGPDGRFLMIKDLPAESGPRSLVVIQHWGEELDRLIAAK